MKMRNCEDIAMDDAYEAERFRKQVFENLDNAAKNDDGTGFLSGTAEDILWDMCFYCADYDGSDNRFNPDNEDDRSRLKSAIQRWLDRRAPVP